jgi:hypothetical protein
MRLDKISLGFAGKNSKNLNTTSAYENIDTVFAKRQLHPQSSSWKSNVTSISVDDFLLKSWRQNHFT